MNKWKIFAIILLLLFGCGERKSDLAIKYYNMGINYAAKQDYDKAIELYKKTIKLEPDYAGAYHNMGEAYKQKGNESKELEYKNIVNAD